MSSYSRQKHTGSAEPLESQQHQSGSLQINSGRLNAIERYPAAPVRCHLIADSYPALHPEFSPLISSVSSVDVFDDETLAIGAKTLLVLPVDDSVGNHRDDSTTKLLEELCVARQVTGSAQLPVVLVCSNPTSLRRMGCPANTLATITNSADGAYRLRRLMRQFGQRQHQRIWIIGDKDTTLGDLFDCHGFDARRADQIKDIDSIDAGVTSRHAAEHILLVSCGPRCFSDHDNCPPHFVSALQGNDLLSMSVILDETSIDMKPAWEERGATTMMLSQINEQTLIEQITQKLYIQHQVAILHHDAVRNPNSGMYNKSYLDDCGRRLHGMASRGSLFFAVAVVQLRSKENGHGEPDSDALSQVSKYISQHLREHDVVAQRFPGELVFLITNSTPPGLQSFLQRLSDNLQEFLTDHLQRDIDLAIGATAENGVSFDAMLHRATMAALQCKIPGSRIVLTL